ncbi:MAG: hypothetical protein ABIP95_16725 [Pelobium sp.]
MKTNLYLTQKEGYALPKHNSLFTTLAVVKNHSLQNALILIINAPT